LKQLCSAFGVTYSCSVWDVVSAREIISLDPKMIKVPSAQNLNWNLLQILTREFGDEIHIPLGMTSRNEEVLIVDFLVKSGRIGDVVLYACTSAYPAENKDICLREIERLKKTYGGIVHAIGFSGHHLGIALDNVAMAFGAEWIERHFTLNRTWKGTDHAASLEPEDLRHLCRDLRDLQQALKTKPEDILDAERAQRAKLKMLIND
jgi:N-acetylneuraminate synthase